MADLNDPNHEPLVTDDVAARHSRSRRGFRFEYHGWKKRGVTPIEDLSWQPYVPLESDGKVLLSKDSIMRIAMVNSRDYQFAFENVYLSALSLDAGAVPVHDSGLQQLGRVLFAVDGRWNPSRPARRRRRHDPFARDGVPSLTPPSPRPRRPT